MRAERSRRWWDGVKEEPVAKRRKGVTKHGRKGPVRMWEDVVIACKGEDWREDVRGSGTQQEWRRDYNEAVGKMFTKWKIPMGTLAKKVKKGRKGQGDNDKEEDWAEDKEREIMIGKEELERWRTKTFKIVVDSGTAAGIGIGMTRLRDKTVKPVFERVTTRMVKWLEEGWDTMDEGNDEVIEWRPRELNAWADRMANESMAGMKSHCRRKCPKQVGRIEDGCIWGFSDGGKQWGMGS